MDEIQVNSPQVEAALVPRASAMFHSAHNFNISGGEFTHSVNVITKPTRKSSEFKDFRKVRLGDLDLREEKQLGKIVGSVSRKRRVYAARVHGCKRPMTAAVYEGADVEEQWLEEVRKYEGLRLPTLVQVYGIVKSRQFYATIYEDDLIPIAEFRQWYSDSEISSAILEHYVDRELFLCWDYLWEKTRSGPDEQTLWIRGSTKRLCLELSKGGDGTKALCNPHLPLHPPARLSGKAQEEIWMSSFKSKHFHSVVAAYASDDVKVEVSPYHFCRPGVILFLPDLNMDSYRDFTVVGLRPGSEVAHIPDQKFHDSGWIYHYQYRNFDSTCTEMENGWIRFWFPDIPAPCENFIERLFTSREDRWTLEAAWLSQAHYIFSRYGIKNDLDSYAFFRRTTYSVSLLDSSHSSMEHTLSGGIFLFLSPIAAGHNPGLWGPAYPAPAFWSLEPSGSHGLLFEDAQALGLPTLSVSASIRGYRWSTEIYRGLVEFQRGKGFNPDSLNVALHCGLPLYQPSLHDGVYPYVELI